MWVESVGWMSFAKNKYDPSFLKCFWDLASTDPTIRIEASDNLLSHVENTDGATGATTNEVEKYAINRLVKGLASSRECARQGFAACLCQLLSRDTVQDTKVSSVLEILDNNTKVSVKSCTLPPRAEAIKLYLVSLFPQIRSPFYLCHNQLTGSIRGAEERDFMFGKLFCYFAIMRSGKIHSNNELSTDVIDRLLDLHKRKGWIREVLPLLCM